MCLFSLGWFLVLVFFPKIRFLYVTTLAVLELPGWLRVTEILPASASWVLGLKMSDTLSYFQLANSLFGGT